MHLARMNFIFQARFDPKAKAGGMIFRDAQIFVHVKDVDSIPIDGLLGSVRP